MSNEIFRKKSMDRVSSPEALNDYIQVTAPSVWLLLGALGLLLLGACVWGIFGRLETELPCRAEVSGGAVTALAAERIGDAPAPGQQMHIEGEALTVRTVEKYTGTLEDKGLLPDGVQPGEVLWLIRADGSHLPDGTYHATVVVESIHPFALIFD